ncbi:MAG TPA: N-glycosylase/DNA lyase [Candidatus Nanoarchaeia archaeon]|nr:N-glycosylase/DNA lyase [Candidatus Nanoarchaeia archaeon]
MSDLKYLQNSYMERKEIIKNRLNYFKSVYNENEKRIFAELCFCLLTPQSKAKICDAAIQNLVKTGLLYTGSENEIKDFLIGVRFNNNKAKYIMEARGLFTNDKGELNIKKRLSGFNNSIESRDWLVNNVNGMGLKESAHFLRNIGIYENLTILDRHILKNLHKHSVIDEIPNPLTKKQYLEIEQKFLNFSKEVGIPCEELDLLFWSEETGEVFK